MDFRRGGPGTARDPVRPVSPLLETAPPPAARRPSGASALRQAAGGSPLRVNALAVGVLTALYVACINSSLYTWGDNAHYVIVAKSIVTGHGLSDIHLPGDPPFAFPIPLFPVLLAPIVAVFDYDLLPLKLFVVATGVAAVCCTYLLFRRSLDRRAALATAALVAVSPQVVSFSHQVMTEVPYLLLSVVALLLLVRYADDEHWLTGRGALVAATVAAALLLRTLGVALLVAGVVYLVLHGRGSTGERARKAGFMAAAAAVVWTAVNASTLGRIAYVSEFLKGTTPDGAADESGLLSRVADNLDGYFEAVPETVVYWLYGRPSTVLAAAVLVVLAAGAVFVLVRRRTVVEYYVGAYAAILLVYEPSNAGNTRRYIVPLIPFLLWYFVVGMQLVWRGATALFQKVAARPFPGPAAGDERSLHPVVLAGVALLLVANLTATLRAGPLGDHREMFDYYGADDWNGYKQMALWTKANTPSDSVVATRQAYFFHFWSRRDVNWYPYVPPGADDGEVVGAIRSAGVDFVTADGLAIGLTDAHRAVVDALQRHPELFSPVYRSGGHTVYRIADSTAGPGP